jgi:hypothetical protein
MHGIPWKKSTEYLKKVQALKLPVLPRAERRVEAPESPHFKIPPNAGLETCYTIGYAIAIA